MDLISIRDLGKKDIEGILDSADELAKGKRKSDLKGKVLATLFFEPSTRTKLSFQSAALYSNMEYIDFLPETSSLKKGESFIDTVKTVAGYADALAIRHPKEGAARMAADAIDKPVVNGGDGANQHPTQTLIDLFSIRSTKGRITGLNVTLLGDLKHARTMRSLVYGLAMYGAKVTLVSPPGLEMEHAYLEEVKKRFPFEVKVKNTREIPVKVEIRRNFGTHYWTIQQSGQIDEFEKVDVDTVKFSLLLPPRSERKFQYTLTTYNGVRTEDWTRLSTSR